MDQQHLRQIRSDAPAPLLGVIVDPLEKLLAESVDVNYQGERVLQLLRLQQADAFYRGIQNIAPQLDTTTGNVAWVSFGQTTGNQNLDNGSRYFDYNPRLTKAYGDKYVAVLGQRPFYDVVAEPGDPTSEDDRRGARQVNLLIQKLQSQWNIKEHNFNLFYNLFKNGTTIGYVRPVTDGNRFGFFEVPDIQMQQQPVGQDEFGNPIFDNVPVQVGVKRYPKSSVELDILNGYTVTYPFNVVHKKYAPWFIVEAQRDRGVLMEEYKNARAIVGSKWGSLANGDQSSTTAAIVRAAAQSQTGTVRSNYTNLWNWRQTWLAPSQLHLIEDDQARAAALQQYPEGCRITQIESKVVEVIGASIDKRFSTCRPTMTDYLFSDGASWGMFNLEDYFANLFEITAETLETGVATYLYDPNFVNGDVINRARYSPNKMIPALPGAGASMDSAIKPLPTSRFPDQIPGMFDMVKGLMESFYGLFPQVYGQMPGNQTLGQARMMLNQGLMQLGTPGELATHFWEESMTNAVVLYVGTVQVNPTHQGQEIDLDLIKRSAWNIKGTTGVPSSFAERKETLQDIIQTNPQLTQVLQLLDPINADKILSFLDLPELENSNLDQIEAMNEVIDQLWSQQPQQGPPNPDGSPSEPQPSIPFDSVVFDPKIASALARQSLIKDTGQKRQGTPGYINVRAFLTAANNATPPEPAEPMKVQASVNLNDLPQNQAEAILGAQGIQVPPPDSPPISTQSDMMEAEQQHQFDMESEAQRAALAPPPIQSPEKPGQEYLN